jgi:hypothetical protein
MSIPSSIGYWPISDNHHLTSYLRSKFHAICALVVTSAGYVQEGVCFLRMLAQFLNRLDCRNHCRMCWLRRQRPAHGSREWYGNHKISIEVILLGATVRDAVHSTLFAASVETEKTYPAAIENISMAAQRITPRANRAFG